MLNLLSAKILGPADDHSHRVAVVDFANDNFICDTLVMFILKINEPNKQQTNIKSKPIGKPKFKLLKNKTNNSIKVNKRKSSHVNFYIFIVPCVVK